jgi:hypothetical protein
VVGCVPVISEDHNTNIVGFQVEGHSPDPRAELHHFACLHLVEAHNPGDTVSNADDSSKLLNIVLGMRRGTTWVIFMILSWMTLAVSAMPSFLEEKGTRSSFAMLLITQIYIIN